MRSESPKTLDSYADSIYSGFPCWRILRENKFISKHYTDLIPVTVIDHDVCPYGQAI